MTISPQIGLKEMLNKSQELLATSLEKNVDLEKDLVRIREDHKNPLKWTILSQILANMTYERPRNSEDLGC